VRAVDFAADGRALAGSLLASADRRDALQRKIAFPDWITIPTHGWA